MNRILIVIAALFLISSLNAQEEKKIIIKKEKTVTVDVENDGNSEKAVTLDVEGSEEGRTIKIRTMQDGEEKVIEWNDNGEIPDDIKKQLEADGIDIKMLGGGDKAVFIGDDSEVHQIRIKKDDGGEKEIEIEWDGEGEMPADMKKILKEHDIDLNELKKGKKGAKMKMKMLKKDRAHGPHKRMMMKEKHKMKRDVKVYMGAQIGEGEGGTSVLDVMVDSPAHKAGLKKGDLITEINGANTNNVDDLMLLLSLFDVNDTVEVNYKRGNKEKSVKIKLALRPEPYR